MAKRKSPLDEELVAQPAQRRSARLQISANATASTATETTIQHRDKPELSTKNTSARRDATNKVNIAHHYAATHRRHLLELRLVTL